MTLSMDYYAIQQLDIVRENAPMLAKRIEDAYHTLGNLLGDIDHSSVVTKHTQAQALKNLDTTNEEEIQKYMEQDAYLNALLYFKGQL